MTNIQTNYTFSGTLTAAGAASGTSATETLTWDQGGTHWSCRGTAFTWNAQKQ